MKPTVLNLVSESLLTEPQRSGSAHPINTGFTAGHPLPERVSHRHPPPPPPEPFPDMQLRPAHSRSFESPSPLQVPSLVLHKLFLCYSHYCIITELSEHQAGTHSDGQEHVLCFPYTLHPEQLLTNGEGKGLAWFKASVSLPIVSGWLLHC